MLKNLFLFGGIAAGKSSLIRDTLLPGLEQVGGFFVQRILTEDSCFAFRLLKITTAQEYTLHRKAETLEELENLFLWNDGRGNWASNIDIFRTAGIQYLNESVEEGKKIILLDEIGGIELQCPPFTAVLRKILLGPSPVLGVLKAHQNADTLEKCLAGRGVAAVNKTFINDLNRDPASELLFFDPSRRKRVADRVKSFVNEQLNEKRNGAETNG